MSIEPDRDQFFQYATFGILGFTLLVCACYGSIFLFPYANPISWLRPPTTQQQLSLQQLPPTWTPIPTNTPTATPTQTPTNTPTDTPTATPTVTDTPLPTATPTATKVPPTPTARPIPPTRPPPPPTNTPIPPFSMIKFARFPNCGTWYISGTVWAHGYGNGFLPSTIVRAWANGAVFQDSAGAHNRNNPAYWEILFPKNTATSGLVGIVDPHGNLLSAQVPFSLTESCKGASAVNQITIDFSGQ